ncbi:MAG: COX15/CtaA family protein, partial [Bacteroidota bacterium]
MLGRLIGLVFVIPFLWFVIRKKIQGTLLLKCLLLFLLGGLQGFIGWYMVASGLVDEPSVSHFRLALHLCTAFITFCFTLWFAMDLINTERVRPNGWQGKLLTLSKVVLVITFIQIIFGAFVAGLKAGLIYNTWPLMGDKFIPDSVHWAVHNMGWHGLIDNMSGVQFVHRNLA